MKQYILNITGFEVPNQFVELANEFEIKFNSKEKALTEIGKYIGYEFVVDQHEIRGYECVPFEAQLPFQTGGNGENMGWLNLAPELEDFDKPFITWCPGGCEIIYHGNDMAKVIEGKMKYLHEHNDYAEIDIGFLNSIGIYPKDGNAIEHFVNYDPNALEPIPIKCIENWRYIVTVDGTGVYANEKYFSPEHHSISAISTTINAIEKTKQLSKDGFFASSIWLIKNTISKSFFTEQPYKYILELYDLAIEAYDGLGRSNISKIIERRYRQSL